MSETHRSVTVAGDYTGGALSPTPVLGAKGARFRIFAPPGVKRTYLDAGALSKWVSAESSRCLYAGYRYESPLAGFSSFQSNSGLVQATPMLRQTGRNFAGQHYTLHRHYDPTLMRFTSPDPLASPFYNLHHYAGNSPGRYYDPDGLRATEYARNMRDMRESADEDWQWFHDAWEFFDRLGHPERYDTKNPYEENVREIREASENMGADTTVERVVALPFVIGSIGYKDSLDRRYMIKTGETLYGGVLSDADRTQLILGEGLSQTMTALSFASMGVGAPATGLGMTFSVSRVSGVVRSLARSNVHPAMRFRMARAGGWMTGPRYRGVPKGFQPFKPTRPPRHHLFPQQHRGWFEARGVKIDKYTFEMGRGEHSAIHSSRFNQKWAKFIADEANFGSRYTARRILKEGVRMKREFKITGRHVPYRD